jgi:hypothetical protein
MEGSMRRMIGRLGAASVMATMLLAGCGAAEEARPGGGPVAPRGALDVEKLRP